MPINKDEEYVIKVKTDNGYRIVGNISVGDYGPRVSLTNNELLRSKLEAVEEGKRLYMPVFEASKKDGN